MQYLKGEYARAGFNEINNFYCYSGAFLSKIGFKKKDLRESAHKRVRVGGVEGERI